MANFQSQNRDFRSPKSRVWFELHGQVPLSSFFCELRWTLSWHWNELNYFSHDTWTLVNLCTWWLKQISFIACEFVICSFNLCSLFQFLIVCCLYWAFEAWALTASNPAFQNIGYGLTTTPGSRVCNCKPFWLKIDQFRHQCFDVSFAALTCWSHRGPSLVVCYPTFWILFFTGLQGWAQLILWRCCTNVDILYLTYVYIIHNYSYDRLKLLFDKL
jgi:hypothetical protein